MHLTGDQQPLLAAVFFLTPLIRAAPQLAFPINSQVPPVAYISQPYSFAFSAATFVSSAPQVSYAIADGPNWLSLDSSSRQFSGVPDGSVGPNSFQLVASDATGDSSTTVVLVVASSQDLSIGAPILPQLERSGPTSFPNSLLLRPQEAFNLSFDQDTFTGTTSVTKYYAVSADNTPLPSWVQFDEAELLLSGSTPALVSSLAGPQTYGFRLIASDVLGFTEAALDFSIVINHRVWGFSIAFQNMIVTPGVAFQSTSFRSLLTLDGHSVADAQLASVDATGAPWINFDKERLAISGVPPDNVNATIVITVTDIYDDTARAVIRLTNNGDDIVQLGSIAALNVTVGDAFSFTIVDSSLSSSTRATATLGSASKWLTFDRQSWTLSGKVPPDEPPQTLIIPLQFENATTTLAGEVKFHILPRSRATAATSTLVTKTQTVPQASTMDTASVPNSSSDARARSKKRTLQIILAVIFSTLGAFLALCFFLLLLRRKQRDKKLSQQLLVESSASVGEGLESNLPEQPVPSQDISEGVTAQQTAPPRPPRLDFAWSSDSIRQPKQRLSSSSRPGPLSQHRISQIFVGEQGLTNRTRDTEASNNPMAPSAGHKSGNADGFPVRPKTARVTRPMLSRQSQDRTSTRLSRQSILPPPVGLPNRRSGAGHGAGILLGAADTTPSRVSCRNSWTTNESTDVGRNTAVLLSFPAPPGDSTATAQNPSRDPKSIPLLRIVSEDSDEPISLEEQRQRWHTERARARLEGTYRFSNAGSARAVAPPRAARRVRSDARLGVRDKSTSSVVPSIGRGPSWEHSWSRWSGVGPAAQESTNTRSILAPTMEKGLVLRSRPSVASSGQFESAASSDSYWEDEENLVVEETEPGGRRWQADNNGPESPRLPCSPVATSRENWSSHSATDDVRQHSRVADQRKHISVEGEGHMKRSYGSQRGSFRFI